jgi:hypothetical protein
VLRFFHGRHAFVVSALLVGLAALCAGCGGTGEYQQRYDAGVQYLNRGEHRKAVAELEQAVEANPDSVDARLKLGDAYTGTKQFDEALDVTVQLLRIADEPSMQGIQRATAYRRIAVLTLRGAYGKGSTSGLQRASTFFEKWIKQQPDAYGAHLGKGLSLLGLERYYRTGASRDNAWDRLASAEQADGRPVEATYFRALAGDRSGQVPAATVAGLYRKALEKAVSQKRRGGGGGPFPEAPDFDFDYVTAAREGLLDLLRRSPASAAADETAARTEATALVEAITAGGGKISPQVQSWLGTGSSGGNGNGSGGTPPPAQHPPVIVTPPWGADRIEPAGLPFTFKVIAQGEAEPTRLEVSLSGKTVQFKEASRKLPVQPGAGGKTLLRTEFTITFLMPAGDHTVEVRPLDARGGRAVLAWESKLRGRTPRKSLIVVGRNGSAAAGAEADATALAAALGDRLDVKANRRAVLIGDRATPEAVVAAVDRLTGGAAATDTLWIYLAAPGGADGSGAPAVALGGAEAGPSWLSLERLARAVRGNATGRVWAVVDAGFGGTAGRRIGEPVTADAEAFLKSMAVEDTRRSVLLGATAGTAAERPGDEPRGLLAGALLEALGAPEADLDGDGSLTAGELAAYVSDLTAFRAATYGVTQDPAAAGDADLPVVPAATR